MYSLTETVAARKPFRQWLELPVSNPPWIPSREHPHRQVGARRALPDGNDDAIRTKTHKCPRYCFIFRHHFQALIRRKC